MTINFPVLKSQKFQIGDVVHFTSKDHFGDYEFTGIVTCSYGQKYGGSDRRNYELFITKQLNPNIKKTASEIKFRLPETFSWATNRELKFIRKLTEEEKIKFLNEFYHIYITL
ncbi:MAG: hypothetical protein IKF82_00855 [Bacilli bacterium]|nr:hypothetical protein [Bacilli bacterium]